MKTISCLLFLSCSLISGEAFSAAPQKQVIVGPDDTVYGIAYNNGIPTRTLISANNLKAPYVLMTGQKLIIPAPNEHIVGERETLQSIAEDYGIKVDILAQENSLQSPYFISPGDSLIIPSLDTESITEALKPPSEEIMTSSLAPLPLIKSAPLPDKSERPLANLEDSPPSAAALPDDLAEELAREKENKESKSTSSSEKDVSESSKKPMIMGNLAKKTAGASAAIATGAGAAAVGATPLSDDDRENEAPPIEKKKPKKKEVKKEEPSEEKKESLFIWPVKGEIINKFGEGGKNDGIDIKVSEGTPVKASADGTVMYAGNELKDFGNLLLIKHKDGWVTAYAHNSSLLVKKGDLVKQGDKIAKSGTKGDSGVSQVHFEIRNKKQPIDPLTKLES